MKRLLTMMLLVLLPTMMMAQRQGGEVRRPQKKENSSQVKSRKSTKSFDTRPISDEIVTVKGISFRMIGVQGGIITIGGTLEQKTNFNGDGDGYAGVGPKVKVAISSFRMAETELTQDLWEAVMGTNPSPVKGAKYPVTNVSWDDFLTFMKRLKTLTGKNFRYPTDAEWEYAARGGQKSQHFIFSGSNNIDEVGWHWQSDNIQLHEVAQKRPNELGFYDMSGNVWEWCSDDMDVEHLLEKFANNTEPLVNPSCPPKRTKTYSGSFVKRGGGATWNDGIAYQKVSYRSWNGDSAQPTVGVRLVY